MKMERAKETENSLLQYSTQPVKQLGGAAHLLVVIQHSVHVLNPDSIYWAVKDQPLPVWGLRGGKGPVADGQNAIRPLVGDGIKGPI